MPFLTFEAISKHFPGVQALDKVSFEVKEGSCHALLGENGAGKSTLGKILAGVYVADHGTIRLNGQPIFPRDPGTARQLGIAMVHQELAFCPNLSVAENLCLGNPPAKNGWLQRSQMRQQATDFLDIIGAKIDPNRLLGDLTTGQEQLVQIAAAVGTGARILVMDEPTSSLSQAESERLFELMGTLRQRGITLLYVSHRMNEIFSLCDHMTVLRDGHHVVTQAVADVTPDQVIRQMIGREIEDHSPQHLGQDPGKEILRVENLSSPGKFSNINFTIHTGEILGFGGLIGAGRSEIAQAVFGLDPHASGRVFIHGQPLPLGNVAKAMAAGIGLVPEDRKRQGLVLSMNCRENTSLAALNKCAPLGWIDPSKESDIVASVTHRLRVKTPSLETPIVGLSGGNQQKLALAKWLLRECRLLIVDEPTRGVDVGAKAEIHRLLDELAVQGIAIWLISSELPELMRLSRRILVLREGQLRAEIHRADFSEAHLMAHMAGLGAH